MTDDIKKALISVFNEEKKKRGLPVPEPKKAAPKKTTKKPKQSISQVASGSHIVQAVGDIHGNINLNVKSTNKKVNIAIQPPLGTIGADPYLVEHITGLFNELGLRREERFGKTTYPVMYAEFKKAFSIPKNQKYTTYKLWPEERAEEIIDYLNGKLGNTIKGRIQNAAKRKGHSSKYLLAETSRLHELLGWTEQNYRAHLHYMFGVTSRSELTPAQLARYVDNLKEHIDEEY